MSDIQSAPYTKYTITHSLPSTLAALEVDVTAAYQHFSANTGNAAVAEDTFELTEDGNGGLVLSWVIPATQATPPAAS